MMLNCNTCVSETIALSLHTVIKIRSSVDEPWKEGRLTRFSENKLHKKSANERRCMRGRVYQPYFQLFVRPFTINCT